LTKKEYRQDMVCRKLIGKNLPMTSIAIPELLLIICVLVDAVPRTWCEITGRKVCQKPIFTNSEAITQFLRTFDA
jgi:hypothetical protein